MTMAYEHVTSLWELCKLHEAHEYAGQALVSQSHIHVSTLSQSSADLFLSTRKNVPSVITHSTKKYLEIQLEFKTVTGRARVWLKLAPHYGSQTPNERDYLNNKRGRVNYNPLKFLISENKIRKELTNSKTTERFRSQRKIKTESSQSNNIHGTFIHPHGFINIDDIQIVMYSIAFWDETFVNKSY